MKKFLFTVCSLFAVISAFAETHDQIMGEVSLTNHTGSAQHWAVDTRADMGRMTVDGVPISGASEIKNGQTQIIRVVAKQQSHYGFDWPRFSIDSGGSAIATFTMGHSSGKCSQDKEKGKFCGNRHSDNEKYWVDVNVYQGKADHFNIDTDRHSFSGDINWH